MGSAAGRLVWESPSSVVLVFGIEGLPTSFECSEGHQVSPGLAYTVLIGPGKPPGGLFCSRDEVVTFLRSFGKERVGDSSFEAIANRCANEMPP